MHTITITSANNSTVITLKCTCGKQKVLTANLDVGVMMNQYHAHLSNPNANW